MVPFEKIQNTFEKLLDGEDPRDTPHNSTFENLFSEGYKYQQQLVNFLIFEKKDSKDIFTYCKSVIESLREENNPYAVTILKLFGFETSLNREYLCK